MTGNTIAAVDQLVKSFAPSGGRRGGSEFRALDNVSFSLESGETLGLVGETGAGKSTIGRCILGLEPLSGGRIELFGQDISAVSARGWKQIRSSLQAVFQDPKGALNPRWTVGQLVREPLVRLTSLPSADIDARVRESLEAVGLGPDFLPRYRHQLSGGQQQRVNIARAIVVEPRCIVLDEPVAALDTSVKRDVIRLLSELRRRKNLAYLLISHDLNVVRILCRKVIILFRGRIVEMGPTPIVMADPRHPYTQQLLAAQFDAPGRPAPEMPAGKRTSAWSPESDRPPPPVGDLVEVESGHFVAQFDED